jgi:hypothetical protein
LASNSVKFWTTYTVYCWTVWGSANTQVAVWAEIYDETDDELVAQYDDWYIQNQITTINRSHDEGGTVTLIAGHVYQFRMVLYTEAYDLLGLGNITYADCYNGARGNDGLDYSSIVLNW